MEGRISLSGAFALYPMAVKWAEEFKKINPRVKIDISAGGAGKGMTDVLNNMVDIGMVSRDISPEELKKGALPIAVCRDAVVGVVNSLNPAINEIMNKGLTAEKAGGIWFNGTFKFWNQLYAIKSAAPIHAYTRSDACGAAEIWSKFFKAKQEDLLGSAVYGDPGLALAIRKDPVGIGFNNICYAYDFVTRKPFKGIQVIPLDLNKNGKIDPDENFYDTLDQLIRAIAEGKYPSPPSRELFFVVHTQPKNKTAAAFLKWILTTGQKFVAESGCINLSEQQLAEQLKKIN
jgi:phosphate transport system substrate-binding protein